MCYDYDTTSIHATPTKTCNDAEIRDVKMSMLNTLTTSGYQTNIHILDNESSSIMRQGFPKNKIKYQMIPPHPHRRDSDKSSIQTFKENFITCLRAADPGYPEKQWDHFITQAALTINLLRNWRFIPKLSAHASLHGTFDYNKSPLAPLGTRVLVHDKTTNCRTWAPRGTKGWYIGPDLEHYWCI